MVRANEAEQTTASGLVIPDTAKEKPQQGTVLAVGPGRWSDDEGKHFPLDVKVGDKVKVKVIEVKEGKISLSVKALKDNPWTEAAKKYKKDDMVQGVVIKFNKHGALVSIEEGVAGLVHVSDFGDEAKLRETLSLGKSYKFTITLFDANEERMTLSYGEKKT